MRDIFNQTIATTPGIATVDELELDLDVATRRLEVDFVATKDDGGILDFSEAFVIL